MISTHTRQQLWEFNNKHFLQVGGNAMGTGYAKLFMAKFDYTPGTSHFCGNVWRCYFMLWTLGTTKLMSFFKYLNQCHPGIKFTAEISDSCRSFLDTTSRLMPDHQLITDLYTKPNNSHNFVLRGNPISLLHESWQSPRDMCPECSSEDSKLLWHNHLQSWGQPLQKKWSA